MNSEIKIHYFIEVVSGYYLGEHHSLAFLRTDHKDL